MQLSQSNALGNSAISNPVAQKTINLLALAAILTGTLFKRMYWHGADIILIAATVALLLTLFFAYQDLEKTTNNGLVARMLTAMLFFLIISAAFSRFHWNGAENLVGVAAVLSVLMAFFLIIMTDDIKLPKQFAITFILYLIYIIGALSFLSGNTRAVLDQALLNP